MAVDGGGSLAAAALAVVVAAGLLAGGTSARAAQAHPALASAGRGFTAYVAGTGPHGNYVTPVNTATNRPGKPIKVGADPQGIAVTPDGKTVYVTNPAPHSGSTVTPIRTATNTPGKPIKVGGYPVAIAFAPRPTRG
jgi:YVTN family beta-propeller protein